MSFFDDKQDVIKIELTSYGKHLLSSGKFQPHFYAFYDDDILYDSRYANLSESQNSPQERILNNTLYNKPHGVFTSIEKTIKERSDLRDKLNYIQKFVSRETNLNNIYPLGTSEFNSPYAPSWKVTVFSGTVDTISLQQEKTKFEDTIKIPQINLKTNFFKVTSADDAKGAFFETYLDDKQKSFVIEGNTDQLYYYFLVEENNSINLKHDFEIEVFEEQEKIANSGSVDQESYKIWHQLKFDKKPTNIKDNILLDDYLYSENFYSFYTQENVEWFLEMFVDDEILPEQDRKNKIDVVYGAFSGQNGISSNVGDVYTTDGTNNDGSTQEDC